MENRKVWKTPKYLVPLVILLAILLAGGVYGIISLVRATPSAPVDGPVDSEVTAPLEEETEIDTTVSSLDQLRALLLREEDLVVTVDIDLEVSESLLVVGNKTVQGQGTLTAPLSLDEKIAIFDVTENAHLTLQGLSLDGNTNADGVNVRRNGKLSYLSGKIIYPAQYGIAVYGEAEIETADIQYAPTAAVFAGSGGKIAVHGGTYTESLSLIMYVERNASLQIDGDPLLQSSGKHGITNRGTLNLYGGSVSECIQYGIVNYGEVKTAYTGEDGSYIEMHDNGKGAIYNYGEGTVDASDIYAYGNARSTIANNGTMTLRDSLIEDSGTNGIYNTADLVAENIEIRTSKNVGAYNTVTGDMTLTDVTISGSTKRAVHNYGGIATLSQITALNSGTHGVANIAGEDGTPGQMTLQNSRISGAGANGLHNEASLTAYGVTVDGAVNCGVYNKWGTLSLSDASISNSTKRAVHNQGGRVELDRITAQNSGTHGIGNIADGATAGNLSIQNSEIIGAGTNGIYNESVLAAVNTTVDSVGNCGTYNKWGSMTLMDVTVRNSDRRAMHNQGGTVELIRFKALNSGSHGIGNIADNGTPGKMLIRDSQVSASAVNGIYNESEMTVQGTTVDGSGNCGTYNNAGVMHLTDVTVTNSTKRAVHNKGGETYLSQILIQSCGTHGVANTIDDRGKAGKIVADGLDVSGCVTNIYNEGPGVSTTIRNSTLRKSERTNVVISYGTCVLDSVSILGTRAEGTYCLNVGKGTTCRMDGDSVVTGAASRGITVHGVFTMLDGEVYGNTSHASGGGVFVDGTFYYKGGSIHDNTATSAGGGINVGYSSSDPELVGMMYMTGGTVYNNAAVNGGGVYLSSGTNAKLTGGTIRNNTATGTGNGIQFGSAGTIGGSLYVDKSNDVRISTDIVVKVTGNTLGKHSAEKPMYIMATGADGTPVLQFESAAVAARLADSFVSQNINFNLVQSGSQLVLADAGKSEIGDLDMTGAETVTVSDFEALKQAVESTTGKKIIVLAADIEMEGEISVPQDATVQIRDDGRVRTLVRDTAATENAFFVVPDSAGFGLKATQAGNLVLDGNYPNVTVSGSRQSLVVTSGLTVIEGAVLQNNGNPSGDTKVNTLKGGLIMCRSGQLKLTEAQLKNGAALQAGALYVESGIVELFDTLVDGNTSGASGGAIRIESGYLTVTGGAFTNNSGTSGGAIINQGANVTVSNTRFEGNTASANGGAIYSTEGSTLTVDSGSTFVGNTAVSGAAVYLNSASTSEIMAAEFDDNRANTGGAVYVNASTVEIAESAFSGNQASGASGGAVYIAGAESQVGITDSTFVENSAKTYGGAMNVAGGASGGVTVSDSVFEANVAGTGGDTLMVSTGQALTVADVSVVSADTGGSGYDVWLHHNGNAGSNNGTLTVSGKVVLGRVCYRSTQPAIKIGGSLTEGSQVTITPYEYRNGLQVIAAASDELLSNGSAWITVTPQSGKEWSIGTDGCLTDLMPKASIGNVKYMTLQEAIRVAKPGDVIQILDNLLLTETVTLPENVGMTGDGVEIEISGENYLALEDGAALNALEVTGNLTVNGDVDLTDSAIAGIITVADNGVVRVGGNTTAIRVDLGENAVVHLNSALTADSFGELVPFTEAEGTTVLTEASDGLIASEYKKFIIDFTARRAYLAEDGAIRYLEAGPTVAKINDKEYEFLADAVKEVQSDEVISIIQDIDLSETIIIDKPVAIQDDGREYTWQISRGTGYTGSLFRVAGTGSLTITGNLALLGDSEGDSALIENAGTFVLGDDVTATAKSTEGAAVLSNTGTATINGTISDSESGDSKGAVSSSGTLELQGATFDANTGRGLYITGGTATIADSVIQKQSTASGGGGAVYLSSGTLTIESGTFRENVAAAGGGVIAAAGSSTVIINDGDFTENCSETSVAGVMNINSTSADCVINGGRFYGNSSAGNGGAVYISGSKTLAINGGSFYDNTANTNATATAVDISIGKNSTVSLSGSPSISLMAKTNSAAVIELTGSLGADALITLQPTEAEYTVGTQIVSVNSFGADCTAFSVVPQGDMTYYIDAEGKLQELGALQVTVTEEKSLQEAWTEILNDPYRRTDAAITLSADATAPEAITVPAGISVTVTDDGTARTITRPGTSQSPVFVVEDGGSLTLQGSIENGLTVSGDPAAPVDGVALVRNEGTFVLGSGSVLTGGNGGTTGSTTGGLFNAGTATVSGTITGNYGRSGGGIYNDTDALLTITPGALLEGNVSGTSGGALYTRGNVTMTGGAFIGNESATQGGAVNFVSGTSAVSGVTFDGNRQSSANNGGTIQVSGNATVTMEHTVIRNSSGTSGGAVYNNGDLTLNDGVLIENCSSSSAGGAIYNNKTLTINGGTYQNNSAGASGGAVYNNSVLTITGGLYQKNTAATWGGAINTTKTTCSISNATFTGNQVTNAANGGGALMISGSQAMTLTNCTVYDNRVGSRTGDIWLNSSASKLYLYDNVQLGVIEYKSSGTKINLDGNLSSDGPIATIRPAEGDLAVGTQLLVLGSDVDGAACQKFAVSESGWYFDADGKLQQN